MKNTRHFKLTSETTVSILGTTLFRVELTIDCAFGKKGDKGGFVEKEENLQGNKAWLYNNAQIEGGGEIWGGEIRGGEIWGGVIWGGVIFKSPLQFSFSQHFAIVCKPGYLRIGCKEFTFEYWKDNFKTIGKANKCNDAEIDAYGIIIDMALKIGDDCFKK